MKTDLESRIQSIVTNSDGSVTITLDRRISWGIYIDPHQAIPILLGVGVGVALLAIYLFRLFRRKRSN